MIKSSNTGPINFDPICFYGFTNVVSDLKTHFIREICNHFKINHSDAISKILYLNNHEFLSISSKQTIFNDTIDPLEPLDPNFSCSESEDEYSLNSFNEHEKQQHEPQLLEQPQTYPNPIIDHSNELEEEPAYEIIVVSGRKYCIEIFSDAIVDDDHFPIGLYNRHNNTLDFG
tara:strand:+ start:931 stop:1449 length:519 start_codon:yes stop_codon:yes gene_type:complete